ncbi:MAG: acyl transferase [Bacteroidota bacterium]
MTDLRKRIFELANDQDFKALAMEVFRFQYENVPVYREFAMALNRHPGNIRTIEEIPFIPVEFFKTHEILCSGMKVAREFRSSGTTGSVPSRHLLGDTGIYDISLLNGFSKFYGDPSKFTFFALTPTPEEKPGSSLIYMISKLMEQNPGRRHGFFLDDFEALKESLSASVQGGGKTMLIGLTYALLDFAEMFPGDYPGLMVAETGGMKGRKAEITRPELHRRLTDAFSSAVIHSEYGMTELLSQAWSRSGGLFRTPPWMKVQIREVNDPFAFCRPGRSGGISTIDLANLYSCSFIATQDLGRAYEDGSFEVLGRFDASEMRGCSLMMQE